MRRFFFLLFLLVIVGGAALAFFAIRWPVGPRSEVFFEVAPGTSSRQIAASLEKQKLIANRYAFDALRLVRGGSLKAGEYRFDHPTTMAEVYSRLVRGDVYTQALTIPEGANLFDIAARIEAAKLGGHEAFLAAAKRQVGLIKALDPGAASLEGYLFPDTYHFARKVTPEQILAAMVRRFRVEAAAVGMEGNMHHVVTLASLVERETPLDAERPMVASVFENRLAHGIPLETDPTVIYAALLEGRYRGTIYQSDLAAESAYNTYKHPGLPPGPICNPGAVSLRAALSPAKTKYLYFVAAGADPQGQSRFAETLEEHQKNVAAYRLAVRGAASR